MSLFAFTLSQQTRIDASPQMVWRVFSDIAAWPRWNRACLAAEEVAGRPWTLGFQFRMVLRMAGVPVPFRVAVVEVVPAQRVAWASKRWTVTAVRTFTFQPTTEGYVVVTDQMQFKSWLLPVRLVYPRPIIRSMSRQWLRSLKERVEEGGRGRDGGA